MRRKKKNMRKPNLKKSCPLWITVIAVLAVAGIVFATVMFTLDLPSTIFVAAEYNIQCEADDLTTVITSFTFGECPQGSTIYTDIIHIRNIGNYEAYVAWTVVDLPAGFSIVLKDINPAGEIPQNDFSVSVLAGELWQYYGSTYGMRLHVTNNNAEVGSYSFTIKFISADSSTG